MQITSDIHVVEGRGFDSNMYILVDDEKRFTLIDTGHDEDRTYLLKYIEKVGLEPSNLKEIVLTHVHIDHSGGLASLSSKFAPEVHVFERGADYIEKGDAQMTLAYMVKGSFDTVPVDKRLKENEKVTYGTREYTVLHTPGHTSCSICLYDEKGGVLISGDTVFAGGSFGRVDFPSGSATQLKESLQRLATLDVSMLLPGHMQCVTADANKHVAMSAKYSAMI